MPPTDLDDAHNGHSRDPLAEADTVKLEPLFWPPPQRRFERLRQVMSGRVQSRSREEELAPLTRVPGWLTSIACGALLLALPQAGVLIYKLSHYDTKETDYAGEFRSLHEDLRAQDQYNQLVVVYENKTQQLLISKGVKPEDLPPIPQRPTFGSKRYAHEE